VFFALFGKIKASISMDISTGDVITPGAYRHIFSDMFEEEMTYELWSYPIETVLAEKVETILSRGVDNTRPRDFYDVYMLSGFDYDQEIFHSAFKATSSHRESFEKITDYEDILNEIAISQDMNRRWEGYVKLMPYASKITFIETIGAVRRLLDKQ